MMFFVFDRLTHGGVRPGQMTEEHLIGRRARRALIPTACDLTSKQSDFFRAVLGLAAGDLKGTGAGERGTFQIF